MPFLPKLYEEEKQTENISNFAGYNHNEKIANNEFYDCKNISLEKYPLLSPRAKRHTSGITPNDGETIVAMSEYDGEVVYVTEKKETDYLIKYRQSSNTFTGDDYDKTYGPKYSFADVSGEPPYTLEFPDDKYLLTTSNMKVYAKINNASTNYAKLVNSEFWECRKENNKHIFRLKSEDYINESAQETFENQFYLNGEYLITETLNKYNSYTLYVFDKLQNEYIDYALNDWGTDLDLENRKTFYSKAEKDWWLEKYKYDETPNISIVKTGAFIYVYPFGKYINMALPEKKIMLTAQDKPLESRMKIEPCDVNGEEYKIDYIDESAPSPASDGEYWYDTRNHVIKQYSSYTATWNTVTSNYIKISYEANDDDGWNFRNINIYDRIKITSLNKMGRRKLFTLSNTDHWGRAYNSTDCNPGKIDITDIQTSDEIAEYLRPMVVVEDTENDEQYLIKDNDHDNDCIYYPPEAGHTGGMVQFAISAGEVDGPCIPPAAPNAQARYQIVISEPRYPGTNSTPYVLPETDRKIFLEGFYGVPYGDPAIDKPREAIVYKIDEEAYQYIVVKGLAPFGVYVQYHMWSDDTLTSEPLRIIKEMPKMDFAMSCNNRIWGCYYGEGADGKVINEIYASGLGDPGRWYSYPGMASDSFTQSVGTEGKWTGCVNYLGSPIFFKENGLYRIYGSNPSQYQLVSNENCRGCEGGSERSVAILNEVLFYKSRDGICTYTGSLPVCISDKLGVSKYKEAIAAADNNKYYVSMSDGADRSLFVYDIRLGMWVKEDNVNIQSIQRVKNDICAFDGNNLIWLSNLDSHSDSTEEGDFEWNFVTGRMYTDYLNKKYIDKLSVRCNIRFGSTLSFFIEYDSNGTYIPVGTVTGRNLGVITLPIKVKRCDHLRLKVVGRGYTEIYSIEQEFVFGGKE